MPEIRPRGVCQVCLKQRALDEVGNVGIHGYDIHTRANGCEGAGKRPLSDDDTHTRTHLAELRQQHHTLLLGKWDDVKSVLLPREKEDGRVLFVVCSSDAEVKAINPDSSFLEEAQAHVMSNIQKASKVKGEIWRYERALLENGYDV